MFTTFPHPVFLRANSPMEFMQMKWPVENVPYFWKAHGFALIQPDYDTPADRGCLDYVYSCKAASEIFDQAHHAPVFFLLRPGAESK